MQATQTNGRNGTAARWCGIGITVVIAIIAAAMGYATARARVSENYRNIVELKVSHKESMVMLRGIDARTSVIEQMVRDLKAKDGRTAAATKEMEP